MKYWTKNETHPLHRVGWRNPIGSLPTRQRTHATAWRGVGRENHVHRI